jgi:hypothetical protein
MVSLFIECGILLLDWIMRAWKNVVFTETVNVVQKGLRWHFIHLPNRA